MGKIFCKLFVDWWIESSTKQRPGFGQLKDRHVLKSLKVSFLQVRMNQGCLFNIRTPEIGLPEIGLRKVSTGEIRSTEVSLDHIRLSKFAPFQIGLDELCTPQIGQVKIGFGQIRFRDICLCQIRFA